MAKDRSDDPPSTGPVSSDMPTQLDMFGATESNRAPRALTEREVSRQERPAVRVKRYAPPPQDVLPMMRTREAQEPPKEARPAERVMKEHELASPVDISDAPIDRGDSLRWTGVTIATAALVLLFANAGTLLAWIDEKPPTVLQVRASEMASGWSAAMDATGITAPRRKLHEKWKAMQAARFGEEAPGVAQ